MQSTAIVHIHASWIKSEGQQGII